MFDKDILGLLLGPTACLVFSLVVNYIQFKKNEKLETLVNKMLEDGTTADVAMAFTMKPIAKTLQRTERVLRRLERQLGITDVEDNQPSQSPTIRREARDLLTDD